MHAQHNIIVFKDNHYRNSKKGMVMIWICQAHILVASHAFLLLFNRLTVIELFHGYS